MAVRHGSIIISLDVCELTRTAQERPASPDSCPDQACKVALSTLEWMDLQGHLTDGLDISVQVCAMGYNDCDVWITGYRKLPSLAARPLDNWDGFEYLIQHSG